MILENYLFWDFVQKIGSYLGLFNVVITPPVSCIIIYVWHKICVLWSNYKPKLVNTRWTISKLYSPQSFTFEYKDIDSRIAIKVSTGFDLLTPSIDLYGL